MLVCHCHRVNDREIRAAVRSGCHTVAQVGEHCGAGTGCGGCEETVRDVVACERRRLAMVRDDAGMSFGLELAAG